MVDATPTPEYDDEYRAHLQHYYSRLEKEARREYYSREGVLIWNVTESSIATYPLRPRWRKILGLDQEYKTRAEKSMRYLTRMIRKGVPVLEGPHLYVKHRKIGLDFEITDLITESVESVNQVMQYTILSLVYQGWMESAAVPSGQIHRGPDILQFPESLIRWGDILKEINQEKPKNKKSKRQK